MNLIECSASAWTGEPKRCNWCDAELTGRRTRWCSDECSNNFGRNHYWTWARNAAARRDDHRCQWPGCDKRYSQVHHKTPILGRHDIGGCHHHLDGLTSLCHAHHLDAHAQLRRDQASPADDQLALVLV